MRLFRLALAFALAVPAAVMPGLLQAQTLTNLYNYDLTFTAPNCPLGANFSGNLVQASDGNIYGTFLSCGANSSTTSNYGGGIFKIVPSTGAYSVVYSCNATGSDCNGPDSLIELPDGNLYGTSQVGCQYGYGCLFSVGLDGSNFSVLHSFDDTDDGAYPAGYIIFNPSGTFGPTIVGCNIGDVAYGGSTSYGNCWQYTPDLGEGFSVYTGLLTMTPEATEGYQPVFSGLTVVNGNFYGTTQLGGSGGNGTLFSYNPSSNAITILEPFSGGTAGSFPSATPKLYSDNNLYGTTLSNYPEPGNPNNGSVWKAGLSSGFTALYDFNTSSDYNPVEQVSFDTAGNLIFLAEGDPSTGNYGELYLEPRAGGSSSLQTLYTFTQNSPEGDIPQTPPFFDNQGHMWTAQLVGGGDGIGSIDEWSLSTETKAPISISASPAVLAPGAKTTISWSTNNSFSDNEKYCFGSGNGDTNWDGVQQTGTYSGGVLSGSTVFQPTATGNYVFAITCGGVESALVTVQARDSSATTLKASPTTVAAGSPLTLTASVSGNGTAATGTVALSTGGTSIGSITLVNGTGSFTASTTGIAAGTYVITASYPGDLQYTASSSTVTVTVTGAVSTTTALTATPNPVAPGASVTLSATVKKTSGSGTPTGTVAFKSGTTTLATSTLNGSGVATLAASTKGYALGTYPIDAVYSGDANDLTSTSSTVNVVVKDLTTTALVITPTTAKVGASITLKATVSATAGGTPTGTVNFVYNGSTLVAANLTGGVASVTVSSAGYPTGNYSITAVYTGDTNQAGSTSSPQTVTLTN